MFRGPVTQLNVVDGHLVVAAGNRLETHQWMGASLQTAAFYDAPMIITSLKVIKNFIAFGDIHKGMHFMQHITNPKQLKLLAKGKACWWQSLDKPSRAQNRLLCLMHLYFAPH